MKTKRIQLKDLKIGMKIKTFDGSINSIVFKEVEDVWDTTVPSKDQRHLIFNNGTEIHCSLNHPIMVYRDDSIVQIYPDDLSNNDIIITDSGVTSLKYLGADDNTPSYIDITVADVHAFFASSDQFGEMVLTHNSQGGVRGGAATLYYPIWHLEIEDMLVLKNNKGTEDSRVRHLDYGVQVNRVMYERYLSNGNITLFSPHDVPELYDSFFIDVEKFRDLYEKAERDPKLRKKTVSAKDLFESFVQERKDTGRLYLMNVDHCNDHSSFIAEVAPVRMSNLCCLSGNTLITVERSDGSIQDIMIKDAVAGERVYSRNIKTGKNEFRNIKASLKTRDNTKVMKITDGNGNSVVCTSDHKIYTTNRGYVEAKDLLENDELLIE